MADALALDTRHEPVEVPHRRPGEMDLLRLVSTLEGQVLEHIVTGERLALPELSSNDARWALTFHENGFASVGARGAEPFWAAEALLQSLWSAPTGQLFVQTRNGSSDDGVTSVWLSSLKQKHDISYMSWAPSARGASMPCCKALEVDAPRDQARVFLSLKDLQIAMRFETQFCKSCQWIKKNISTWVNDMARMRVPESHLLRPISMPGTGPEPIRVQEWFASCVAALIIMTKCTQVIVLDEDRDRAEDVLRGVIAHTTSDGVFVVDPRCAHGHPESGHPVNIINGNLTWDFDTGPLDEVNGATIVAVLQKAWQCAGPIRNIALQFFWGVAVNMESAIRTTEWTSNPLDVVLQSSSGGPRRKADRRLRLAMQSLAPAVARNAFRATQLARALNID